MSIGIRMREKRKALEVSQEYIAGKVGVSKQTIQRYESGEISNIPSDKLEKIASALKTTPAYLMGWESENENDGLVYRNEEQKAIIKALDELSANDLRLIADMISRMKK